MTSSSDHPQTPRPTITADKVEMAEAVAGFTAGQKARAAGVDPAAIRALGSYGQSTRINADLELLPLTVQVQLCLMERAALFPDAQAADDAKPDMRDGLKKLTHLAYCFAFPEDAYEVLTCPERSDEQKRRDFSRAAFELMRHFSDVASIDLLTEHIQKEMGLLERAAPKMPEPPQKKTGPRRSRRR